jgi:hypothetical protein
MEAARKKGHNFNLLAKPIHPKDLLEVIGQSIQCTSLGLT